MIRRSAGAARLVLAVLCLVGLASACGADASPSASSATSAPGETSGGPSPGCDRPDAVFAGVGDEGTLEHEGEPRRFSLAVPDGPDDEPRPLIVNMHGATKTAAGHERSSEMGRLGTERGYVVVAPQALGDQPIWNLSPDGDDLSYVEALIDQVGDHLCIDRDRIYLTGFSMGGMMSHALACRQPGRYAAIAPVAGAIDVEGCDDRAEAVPLLAFHGTADDIVRFDGTFQPNVARLAGGDGPPRAEVVESWAEDNGCAPTEPAVEARDDIEHVVHSCPTTAAVELYVVEGGGHTWPGAESTPYRDAAAGPTTQTISATELILDFFDAHG